jgi:hypothetical protein
MRRKPPATFVRSTPVLHERVQKKNWECDLPWKSFSSSLSFCALAHRRRQKPVFSAMHSVLEL